MRDAMINAAEVREKLAALANHELSLGDFEGWLGPASWNMHADSSAEAIDLVSSIHLLLSEYDHGDVDESELRQHLLSLLDDVFVVIRIDATASASVDRRRWPVSKFAANASSSRIDLEVQVPA